MDINNLQNIVGEVAENKPATIRFYGKVTEMNAQQFIGEFLWLQENVRPSNITVRINSEGGSVVHGMSVFSVIKACPIEVRCIVDGIAASMGSVIWGAGDKSYMNDYSLLMIHNPFNTKGNTDIDTKNMVNAFKKQIETVYHKRFGLPMDKVRAIMNGRDKADGTFLTAEEAVNAGIIPASHVLETSEQIRDKVKCAIEGMSDIDQIACTLESLNVENEPEEKEVELIIDNVKQIEAVVEATVKQPLEKDDAIITKNDNKLDLITNTMDKNFSLEVVAAQLGVDANASITGVTSRITALLATENALNESQAKVKEVEAALAEMEIKFAGKETEVANLKSSIEEVKAELQRYKNAEQEAKNAEIAAMVDNAIADGKITGESKETWINMANNNFELTKATLDSISARTVISQEIANDPDNKSAVQNAIPELTKIIAEKVTEVVGKEFEFKNF